MNKIKIISMYTPKYESTLNTHLLPSIQKFNLDYHFFPIEETGSWEKNCAKKSTTVLEALKKFPSYDIVWLDADAIIEKSPDLFFSLDCDFAYHKFFTGEAQSGTLFFKNNPKTLSFVCEWISHQNQDQMKWDQKTLAAVLKSTKLKLSVVCLPASYCKIFDCTHQVSKDRVIVHYQVSRKLK